MVAVLSHCCLAAAAVSVVVTPSVHMHIKNIYSDAEGPALRLRVWISAACFAFSCAPSSRRLRASAAGASAVVAARVTRSAVS